MEQSIFQSNSVRRTYFNLALPIVFSMILTVVYNITDTYFIAMTKNTQLVAGVSLCTPIFMFLMAFGNIFGQGGSSLISRLMGQNDTENLHRVSSFCFYASILFGVVVGALMLVFRDPLLHLLGSDADTFAYASPYYVWLAIGAPILTLSFVHSNLLRAEGRSKESMIATVGGSIINIVLDPILIFGLNMGAAGAAIATVLGYLFTDCYCLFIVCRKSQVLSINPIKWKISGGFCGQIFGIGTSAALSNLMQSICLILTNQCLLPYGNDKIAAMGIVQKVSMIVMLVLTGFSFGGAPLIGYYYGAKDQIRLKELLSFVMKFLCISALAMSTIMIFIAPSAIGIFLSDKALAETGALMLRTQVVSMIFMAMVLFVTIIFQATGKSLPALILSLSRQGIVFVAVLFVAVRISGYYGVLLTQAIADLLSVVLALLFLHKQLKKDSLLNFFYQS